MPPTWRLAAHLQPFPRRSHNPPVFRRAQAGRTGICRPTSGKVSIPSGTKGVLAISKQTERDADHRCNPKDSQADRTQRTSVNQGMTPTPLCLFCFSWIFSSFMETARTHGLRGTGESAVGKRLLCSCSVGYSNVTWLNREVGGLTPAQPGHSRICIPR